MIDSSTMTFLDEPGQPSGNYLCHPEVISFELDVAGKTTAVHINVVSKRATLADIVPMARILSTKLAISILTQLRQSGQTVPCRKGCSACCSYLIPLSVPEVFRLREELLTMPLHKASRLLEFCQDTATAILKKKPPAFPLKSSSENEQSQISQISEWYKGLKVTCPFLLDRLCTLYELRPLACREHLVTSPSPLQQTDREGEPDVASMPVSVLKALGQLAAELEDLDTEAIMLPLAFAWAQDELCRAKRTWPAVTMIKRFAEILQLMASKNFEIPALSN